MTFTVTWEPRICRRTERTGDWVSGRVACFKSFMFLPRFHTLSLWATSYARTRAMSREGPLHLAVHYTKNTTYRVTIRLYSNLTERVRLGPAHAFPPGFRRLSASSRQAFHRVLHKPSRRLSSENPRLSHKFYAHFSYEKSSTKRRAFSSAFSCDFRKIRAG